MRSLPVALLPVLLILGGCVDSPLGTYRVDSAAVLQSSCNGIAPARASAFSDALSADPGDDLSVGRAGPTDPYVAQLVRSDSTVLFAELSETSPYVWEGSRVLTEVGVAEAKLGADFSALLEGGGACNVDLSLDVTLSYRNEEWDAVDATLLLTLTESNGGTPCDINVCTAEFRVAAAHTGGTNPGIQATE